jgi:tRNA (cytidine/uridine-2'-O-)-methyltransferase
MTSQAGSYKPRFNVVLFQPEIPGNTGAIGRTCVAFEAKLYLVRPLGFQIDEKRLRRAGLDYWPHLPFEIADHWDDLKTKIGDTRFWMFTRFADRDFATASFQPSDTIVFGSETTGLPKSLTELSPEQNLRIPTSRFVRSLNLASSVALACFELRNQLEQAEFASEMP